MNHEHTPGTACCLKCHTRTMRMDIGQDPNLRVPWPPDVSISKTHGRQMGYALTMFNATRWANSRQAIAQGVTR